MKFVDYLEREKLTYAEVAAHLYCTKNTIYRIARGIHFPKPSLAKMIEELTNGEVTTEELYADRPRKHYCPECGHKLGVRNTTKKVEKS